MWGRDANLGKERLALVRVQLHQQLVKSRGDPSLEALPSPAPLEAADPTWARPRRGPVGSRIHTCADSP